MNDLLKIWCGTYGYDTKVEEYIRNYVLVRKEVV